DYLTSGIHIDTYSVNDQPQPWKDNPATYTNQNIRLPKPLMPHDSVKISFTWHFQISLESGREGMLDSTTYFLAYAYPRIAVYDDYNGWDRMTFTDAQEFYNDFNDYTLNVQVPKNYIVWSTGVLLNTNEVLQPEYAQKLNRSLTSDVIIHVATKADLESKKVTTQNAVNTWRWKADYVPDVTFAVSDHYVWDASSVIVDDKTQRRASVQSAFNDTAADFHRMVEFGKHSLDWFSHNWPGVAYPYPKTTIVQGYADMEYPMMVNDSHQQDMDFARFVAEHEIAHTWFPFYMGINETRYAFMDEGWATTLELLIGREDMGTQQAETFYKRFRINSWARDKSSTEDLPIITPEDVLGSAAYGNNAYGKPSLGYLAVKEMLGDDLFKKALHTYMDRWNGKHPIPWDFFNSINDGSGKNLNWFWNNWFFTNGYIDLAVDDVKKSNGGYAVTVKNIGGFAAPFDVLINYADGTTETIHQTAGVWEMNQKQMGINIKKSKSISSVQLNGGIFVDADAGNNKFDVK
ncbi:MAG: aminopeptidase, partial [Chitinophagaceae bacterium]|nr:aminopeptidase [Chitinophagaceae bacterium]